MNKILIVNNEQAMRENIVESLVTDYLKIDAVANGEIALERVKVSTYDVVLLDLNLPGISAIEILPLIKKENPAIQVVTFTASSSVENAVEAMRMGADDYITKPFSADELRMTVNKCLDQAKFNQCKKLLDVDDTFVSLADTVRREILLLIDYEVKIKCLDICHSLRIEDHAKVNFHLEVLREAGLVERNNDKIYTLSAKGKKVVACFNVVVKSLTS